MAGPCQNQAQLDSESKGQELAQHLRRRSKLIRPVSRWRDSSWSRGNGHAMGSFFVRKRAAGSCCYLGQLGRRHQDSSGSEAYLRSNEERARARPKKHHL